MNTDFLRIQDLFVNSRSMSESRRNALKRAGRNERRKADKMSGLFHGSPLFPYDAAHCDDYRSTQRLA